MEPSEHDRDPAALEPADVGDDGRQGFALAGALLALVLVGALVTGSFFAASQEQSIGISSKYSDEAMYLAETGLNQVSGNTPLDTLEAIDSARVPSPFTIMAGAQTAGNANVGIIRVGGPNSKYFLFVSRGQAVRGGRYGNGTRVLGLLTREMRVYFPTDRAMQLYRGAKVQGSALISGQDTFPPGPQWSDCDDTGLQNSVVTRDTTLVKTIGNAAQIIGPMRQEPGLGFNDFTNYGGVTYDQLADMATWTLPDGAHPDPTPSGTATTCNTSDPENWSEPGTAVLGCKDYFPIIHVLGDLMITSNGRGQGILLVDGDIVINGTFEFWGITITKRGIKTAGNGGHLNGTVMAMDSLSLDNNIATGNSVVELSSCAVKRASSNIPGFNRAAPVRMHSWVDLTAVGARF
jgi:hypothetical protein